MQGWEGGAGGEAERTGYGGVFDEAPAEGYAEDVVVGASG